MRNAWPTTLITAAAIMLLTGFIALQFYWQREASLAERDRLQKRAESAAANLAGDFNREIQSLYFTLQAESGRLRAGDAATFARRFKIWSGQTPHPELIKNIVYVPMQQESSARLVDLAAGTFAEVPKELDVPGLIAKYQNEGRLPTLIDRPLVLAVPVHPESIFISTVTVRPGETRERKPLPPSAEGHLLVWLDRDLIGEKILPELASRHFPQSEFNLAVTDRSGESVFASGVVSEKVDASAKLFDLKPTDVVYFSNVAAAREDPALGSRDQAPAGDVKVDIRSVHKTETVTVESSDGSQMKRSVITRTAGPNDSLWDLRAQHTAGSIAKFIDVQSTRNIAIGSALYLLLVGSILAIVVSAHRSKTFARRQVDFVSSVSHEFRTPLAVIYSAGENLADGVAADRESVHRYGDLIKNEGKKLSLMVEQILEFAGAKSGRKRYNLVRTDLSDVVRDAIEQSRSSIEEHSFEFETDVPESLPAVLADAPAVSRAVQNLIHNAIKYGNGTRWLKVSAAAGNGSVGISVVDRGIGFEPSLKAKIFEPFYRAPEVVDAQIHGSGLGLSLVKEIVDAHGGIVKATGEPGSGSTFTIEIPVAK